MLYSSLSICQGTSLLLKDDSNVAMIQQVDKKLLFIPIVFILLRMWGTLEFVLTELYSNYFCINSLPFLRFLSALRFLQVSTSGVHCWYIAGA